MNTEPVDRVPRAPSKYVEYERRKRELIDTAVAEGRVLMPAIYEREIRRIAAECGV